MEAAKFIVDMAHKIDDARMQRIDYLNYMDRIGEDVDDSLRAKYKIESAILAELYEDFRYWWKKESLDG